MNGFPLTLIDLAGSAALLLWGVHMVQTGVQRTFGAALRRFLAERLRNRVAAFGAGLAVTALLQSSTATGLMVAGYAAEGPLGLVPALAAMLGANVGTTLIVQLVSFHVDELAPLLILIGVVMWRRSKAAFRDFGRVPIGLGLLLMSLGQFTQLLAPFADQPSLRTLLGAISDQPFLDVIVGSALAWAAHSSVAIVLVAMGFAAQGTVSPDAAFALVLGANLGTAVNPVLEAGGGGGDPAARRLPVGNLLTRVAGVAVALPLMGSLGRLAVTLAPDASRSVADFHTGFNLVVALILFPLLGPYATLLRRVLPSRVDARDPSRPLYLAAEAREAPVVALGHAQREALRLVDFLLEMLDRLDSGLLGGARGAVADGRRLDAAIERLNGAIEDYVGGLDRDAMSEADEARAAAILTFGMDLELAAGIVDRSLLAMAQRRIKRGLLLAGEPEAALRFALDRVRANARAAASLLLTADRGAAEAMLEEKQKLRRFQAQAIERHLRSFRDGAAPASEGAREAASLALEAISELKRVNNLLIAASAYPVLDRVAGPDATADEDEDLAR